MPSPSGKIRIGVIGTGFGVNVHLPALTRRDDIEVVSVCSAQRERARTAAEAFGVPNYTDDYRELVRRDDIDLVDITVPPILHAEMAAAAFEAGKHVLCEKPLAMDAVEAAAMVKTAQASGLVHAVNHEKRYLPTSRLVRKLVRDGDLGTIGMVVLLELAGHGTDPTKEPYYWGWIARRSQGGGFIMSHLSHQIDILRFCFGNISDVKGRTASLITERPVLAVEYRDGDPIGPESETVGAKPVDVEDSVLFAGTLEGDALLSVSGSWSLHFPTGTRLEAYGSEGSLVMLPDDRILFGRTGEPQRDVTAEAVGAQPIPGVHRLVPPTMELVGELVRNINGDPPADPLMPTFEDGLALLEVVDAVRRGPHLRAPAS